MGREILGKMKTLVKKADIVTPNLTELAFLTDNNYNEMDVNKIKKSMKKLANSGPRFVVVTSVPIKKDGQFSVLGFDDGDGRFWRVTNRYIPVSYPGTGDTFSSVLLGCMMRGENFPASIDTAVQFVSRAIHRSFGFNHKRGEGPAIESVLNTLQQSALSYTYEEI